MKSVIILSGISGAGKTTYIRDIVAMQGIPYKRQLKAVKARGIHKVPHYVLNNQAARLRMRELPAGWKNTNIKPSGLTF